MKVLTAWIRKTLVLNAVLLAGMVSGTAQNAAPSTYCNPVNIDYGYSPYNWGTTWAPHRTTADPVIVNYQGDFYLFSTNQEGYWWSPDLSDWTFIQRNFLRPWNTGTKDDLCAPAVGIVGDTMIVFGSTYSDDFTLWMSTDPKGNVWKPLVERFAIGGWDPAFFTDDDGRLYMYNGSSNVYPLQGVELDRKTFEPIGARGEQFLLEPWRFGWQRFGEHSDNTFLDPFIEGATMTRHNGKYYLQYGAPGTEFSGYADGVAVGNEPVGIPFGNFTEQSDPLSMKLGGYARGAGHGSTFQDNDGRYWHTSTIMLSVKNNFERRIGIWPTGFDGDDVMWCNTAFGDYPHYLPDAIDKEDFAFGDGFTGWMLLNYKKPIAVSSTYGGHRPNHANDEDIKTYWSAVSADREEWIQSDLGDIMDVRAIQINFADQSVDTNRLGKDVWPGQYHRYIIRHSTDGQAWDILVDKSENMSDVPHDYVELAEPDMTRYIRLENVHMPTGKFAISGLRVFGHGNGERPDPVKTFMVLRTEKDKRSAWMRWSPSDRAYAYNIYYGTHPEKLYNCIMVYDHNEFWFKSMDSQVGYYFTIEAINEHGVSERYEVVHVE